MSELDKAQEAILAECLEALEGGANLADCLARYPDQAEALRPYLELRANLLSLELPDAPPASYEIGRQALLERVVISTAEERPWFARPWSLVPRALGSLSPLARGAAASLALLLLAGGALGASAAGGFDPAQDILSTLNIVTGQPQDDAAQSENADEGSSNANDGIANAPTAAPGREQADDRALEGGDVEAGAGAPEVVPGVGLCLDEGTPEHPPDLPDQAPGLPCNDGSADVPPGPPPLPSPAAPHQ